MITAVCLIMLAFTLPILSFIVTLRLMPPSTNKCVNVCRLEGDRCIGCGRTIAAIIEDGLRAENARKAMRLMVPSRKVER